MSVTEIFGHKFKDITLLKQALTHPSCIGAANYQKLEFLGDRILGLVMAEYLFAEISTKKEGDLAKRHVGLVCGDTLAKIALENKLGSLIIMSKGEENTAGRANASNLADVVEALIAAIYLDSQDFQYTKAILLKLWRHKLEYINEEPFDPKSELQELLQARKYPLPEYKLLNQSGLAHAPVFTMALTLPDIGEVKVTASSKKKAEVELATKMLDRLKNG